MKKRLRSPKLRSAGGSEKADLRQFGAPLLLPCLVIAAVILAVIIARIRLLDVPLERDEGEYGYFGQLVLQGIPPYGVAANMKLPGIYLAYALIMAIFGQTTVAIHLGLLLVDLASAALIYAIGRRLFPADLLSGRLSSAALAAAGAFSVLSIGQGVMGLWAHATHFVVVFALAATLTIMKWGTSRNVGTLLGSGLLYGVAFVMKQPGILFAPFGAIWIVWTYWGAAKRGARIGGSLILFFAAAIAPFGVVCLWLWRAGVFSSFWFWIVTYGRQYGSMITLSRGFQLIWLHGWGAATDAWAIWLLAIAGAFLQWRTLKERSSAMFLLAFFALAFAAVCPGLYFREHYFVLILPSLALLASAVIADAPVANGLFGRTARMWTVAIATVLPLISQRQLLFELSPSQASKLVYFECPFVEAIEVGNYINTHAAKGDKVAILGSEPEILFYAGRRSATPFVYMYSMTEEQPYAARMQDEFIHDIETAAPEYIVMVNNDGSWALQKGSTKRVMDWWPAYGAAHYEPVGLADMLPGVTNYYWDASAAHAIPRGHDFLALLKRKAT